MTSLKRDTKDASTRSDFVIFGKFIFTLVDLRSLQFLQAASVSYVAVAASVGVVLVSVVLLAFFAVLFIICRDKLR